MLNYSRNIQVIISIVVAVVILLILGGGYYFISDSLETGYQKRQEKTSLTSEGDKKIKENLESSTETEDEEESNRKGDETEKTWSDEQEISTDKAQITDIDPQAENCEDLTREKKKRCLSKEKSEEAILKMDVEQCAELEYDDIKNECFFKIAENKIGGVNITQEKLNEAQEACQEIINKNKKKACLEDVNANAPYDLKKTSCEQIYSEDREPWALKKCRDRTFAFEIKERIKEADSESERADLLSRCFNNGEPRAEEYSIACKDYGLEEIDYNCGILKGKIKDHCLTEKIYQENRSMTVEDCQEIPLEKERKVCIQEIETQTSRIELDSDGDGVSDAKELSYNTDPFDPDTDNDELMDGEEMGGKFHEDEVYNTNPLNSDTDGDGFTDYEEIKEYETNPLDPQERPQ